MKNKSLENNKKDKLCQSIFPVVLNFIVLIFLGLISIIYYNMILDIKESQHESSSKFFNLDVKLDNLDSKFDNKIDTHSKDNQREFYDTIYNQFNDIQKEINSKFSKFDDKIFDHFNDIQKEINSKFDKFDNKIYIQLADIQKETNAKFDNIFGKLDSNLDNFIIKLTLINTKLSIDIHNIQKETNFKLDKLDDKFYTLYNKLSADIKDDIKKINDKINDKLKKNK